ncbi:hypothetical protein pb186bvf_020850 [Paramecium bursaria]
MFNLLRLCSWIKLFQAYQIVLEKRINKKKDNLFKKVSSHVLYLIKVMFKQNQNIGRKVNNRLQNPIYCEETIQMSKEEYIESDLYHEQLQLIKQSNLKE